MILAAWLLSLPFRLLAALGLRRGVILACLFVLAVTAYGVAGDLGLLDPPAAAKPAPRPRQATPSAAPPCTLTPARLRSRRKICAAISAGRAVSYRPVQPRLTMSAERAGDSWR